MNSNIVSVNHADKDEVKLRVNIVDVVRSYNVTLEKKGKQLLGFCPFHNDVNNPNLYVSEDKQLFHCKACGAGGDVFTFVKLKEQCEFLEAVDRLARQYGITNRASTNGRTNHKVGEGGNIHPNNTLPPTLAAPMAMRTATPPLPVALCSSTPTTKGCLSTSSGNWACQTAPT